MAQAQGNRNVGMRIGKLLFPLPDSSSVAATLHLNYLVLFLLYPLILTIVWKAYSQGVPLGVTE